MFVPKYYTASTKLSDEYKETDLTIGLSKWEAKLNATKANQGINDMGVYRHILETEDFARTISRTRLSCTSMTYGEYLGEEDTIEVILENINYNFSRKAATLTISFTDRDALIASQMLDSVTHRLQDIINASRQLTAQAVLENASNDYKEARQEYLRLQKAYSALTDGNNDIKSERLKNEEESLEKELYMSQRLYEKSLTKYIRQKALSHRAYTSFAVINPNQVPLQSNDHWISYVLSFVIIALVLTKAYRLLRSRRDTILSLDWGDFFSPWCLTAIVWIGDIAFYYIQGTLDPIGPKFWQCFALWLATFLPCSFLAYNLSKDDKKINTVDHSKPIDVNMYAFYGFLFLSLSMTLLYAKAIYEVVSQFDTDDMLYNVRLLVVKDADSLGRLNNTPGLNLALFLVAIWLYPRISKWTVALIVVINIILQLAMMEKSGFLIMTLGTLFVLYERGKIRVRTIGVTLLGIIVFFFYFNMSKEQSSNEESMDFMDFFGMYVTSPMVAFEQLKVTITDAFGSNTFNDFYPQLQRFGIFIDTNERLQEFVFVPIPTNVYTIMQPFYNDFGTVGVAFFGFLYGTVFGYVYCKFREGNTICKCFYTFLVEVIAIQFYNENLIQVFHLVMETAIIIVIMVELTKVKLRLSPSKVSAHETVQ